MGSQKSKLLDNVQTEIDQNNLSEALKTLYFGLNTLHNHCSPEEWKEFISQYQQHPASRFFLQDPLTRRAFEKPRGYAGDAVMMDYVYALDGIVPLPFSDTESNIQKQLYEEFNFLSSACKAVRERRKILSKKIDETANRIKNPSILSVACGHSRELFDSSAVKQNTIGKFVALDQDKESLSIVDEIIDGFGETVHASVIDIIRGKTDLANFDFIYTAGLYDYLPDKIAAKLTNKLFEMLNPGGSLLIANFIPGIPCRGYMEACMDWWLIYRDEVQMKELISKVPKEEINSLNMFIEKNQNIIFFEIEKNHYKHKFRK